MKVRARRGMFFRVCGRCNGAVRLRWARVRTPAGSRVLELAPFVASAGAKGSRGVEGNVRRRRAHAFVTACPAAEQFKEITKAYEILSDDTKRKLYDEGGEDAVENGGGGGDPHDIFSAFFGGGGRRERGPKKGEDLVHPIQVDLENLYNGKTVKLSLTRDIICTACKGSGSKNPDANTTCQSCEGNGVKLVIRQIAPGMIQQMQMKCPDCDGSGTSVKAKDRCTECSGKKVKSDKKVLEVNIDKGMKNNQKITFPGEADQKPGIMPGDVVFVLQQKEHKTFKRKNDDLLIQQKIPLVEALCGTNFIVTHLDGRKLVVKTQPGELIRPGDVKTIDDEGMPMHKNPFVKVPFSCAHDACVCVRGHHARLMRLTLLPSLHADMERVLSVAGQALCFV